MFPVEAKTNVSPIFLFYFTSVFSSFEIFRVPVNQRGKENPSQTQELKEVSDE